ncbi:DUF1828 domain-containing protein [Sporolactobacillus vineae]|uniref:DUF1828 domain-containing protein n=1 Tax=Sporolactobacillus vineae TaxID=444463 RepID=UPI00028A2681|nr:DUF1828 domain-containing protein [Sporolactobacillus vineae]
MTYKTQIKDYLSWLNNEITFRETDHGLYVITPFLTIDNDYIVLRIDLDVSNKNKIIISDDAKTMQYLFLRDYDLNPDRLRIINSIANKLGLDIENNELTARTDANNFGRMFTNIISGINNVSNLSYTVRAREPRTFRDDVNEFLIKNKVVFDTNYKIMGKSAEYYYEFMIPKKAGLLIDPLSARSISSARRISKSVAFKTMDIKQASSSKAEFAVIIDDIGEEIWDDKETRNVLSNYMDRTFKWKRDKEEILKFVS